MINCKPEGRKKRRRPRRTWKDGIMGYGTYTAMGERWDIYSDGWKRWNIYSDG